MLCTGLILSAPDLFFGILHHLTVTVSDIMRIRLPFRGRIVLRPFVVRPVLITNICLISFHDRPFCLWEYKYGTIPHLIIGQRKAGINDPSEEHRIQHQFAAPQPKGPEIGIVSNGDHLSATQPVHNHCG
jgi:hypothetical protein